MLRATVKLNSSNESQLFRRLKNQVMNDLAKIHKSCFEVHNMFTEKKRFINIIKNFFFSSFHATPEYILKNCIKQPL